MDENDASLSIGAFARRVGLTPSALRFYDDCAVLRPARVDQATGYRFYGEYQEPRAVLLRRLRSTGLPLSEVTSVLDGSAEDTRTLLREHLHRMRAQANAAQEAVAELLRSLPVPELEAVLGGPELASAIRQVVPSAATREGYPVLGCVLIEFADAEVRLVATDRYRLAMRVLLPRSLRGDPARLLVPAPELARLGSWAARAGDVAVEFNAGEARLRAGAESVSLPIVDGDFPAYREILRGLDVAPHRIIVDRTALRAALADGVRRVLLRADGEELVVEREHECATMPAICQGRPPRIAFDPAVLGPAVEAGVGPDVLLEIAGVAQPVVVRSADQGSFTTLVMPVATEDSEFAGDNGGH
ncbi:MerR HTH family regulatory protein [Amycolatopsis marina]|uniref:MerR HTH family regulatory protein n=1 Tax=Amycolatopsis marina TaxID=490629 RepID=A0A1I1A320_9PSEU|nr:MerR family transcriptional regulator [Amycolatopsis marina]SFB31892.1 MerR HTH family regulatory protein [Amycolatopsis marina]